MLFLTGILSCFFQIGKRLRTMQSQLESGWAINIVKNINMLINTEKI